MGACFRNHVTMYKHDKNGCLLRSAGASVRISMTILVEQKTRMRICKDSLPNTLDYSFGRGDGTSECCCGWSDLDGLRRVSSGVHVLGTSKRYSIASRREKMHLME